MGGSGIQTGRPPLVPAPLAIATEKSQINTVPTPTVAWTRASLARKTYTVRWCEKGEHDAQISPNQSYVGSSGQTLTTAVSMVLCDWQSCQQTHVLCGCNTFVPNQIADQIDTVPTPAVAWTRAWLLQRGWGVAKALTCFSFVHGMCFIWPLWHVPMAGPASVMRYQQAEPPDTPPPRPANNKVLKRHGPNSSLDKAFVGEWGCNFSQQRWRRDPRKGHPAGQRSQTPRREHDGCTQWTSSPAGPWASSAEPAYSRKEGILRRG